MKSVAHLLLLAVVTCRTNCYPALEDEDDLLNSGNRLDDEFLDYAVPTSALDSFDLGILTPRLSQFLLPPTKEFQVVAPSRIVQPPTREFGENVDNQGTTRRFFPPNPDSSLIPLTPKSPKLGMSSHKASSDAASQVSGLEGPLVGDSRKTKKNSEKVKGQVKIERQSTQEMKTPQTELERTRPSRELEPPSREFLVETPSRVLLPPTREFGSV